MSADAACRSSRRIDEEARLRRHRADLAGALASGAIALAIAVVALRAWRMDLFAPINYRGDAMLHLGFAQNVLESGSYLHSPRLGAPFGQFQHDYAQGADNLNFLLLRVFGLLTGDASASVNLFYLLTFGLVATAAYVALRGLATARPVAVVGAVVYAIVPFHFLRGTGHLFLSAYYAVPLVSYALVRILDGRGLLRRRRDVLPVVLIGALVASTGAYYAAFTLLLLVPAAVFGWYVARTRRVLWSVGLLGAVVILVLALNNAPTLLYWLERGTNPDLPSRGAVETTQHQLQPIRLVTPLFGHRIPPFADIAARLAGLPATGENGESLGLVGAIGLILLVAVAVGALVGAFARRRLWVAERRLSALMLATLGIAISGGLSTLIAVAVTAQIRAWSRLSVFIAFFSILAVCLVLNVTWRRYRSTRWRTPIAIGLCALVGFAAFDQTAGYFVPSYEATRDAYRRDQAFVREVEASLPPGAAIYQLPYRPYPEGGPVAASTDYDPLVPYLMSEQLRWSYGGVKGREAGWQPYVYGRPPPVVLPLVHLAGFSAVWVDRNAYADTGAAEEVELRAATGDAPLISHDGRYAVFDLGSYGQRLDGALDEATRARLRNQLMAPVWLRWSAGALHAAVRETGQIDRPVRTPAGVTLHNSGGDGRKVTVSFGLAASDGAPVNVEIRWPDGSTEQLALPSAVSRTLALRAGDNAVAISIVGGGRDSILLVSDLWAMDPDLLVLSTD